MPRIVVRGRTEIVQYVDASVEKLVTEIMVAIKDKEAEYVDLLIRYTALFANLTEAVPYRPVTPEYMVRSPIWLRISRGMTLVLNMILSILVPVTSNIDSARYQEVMKGHLRVVALCYDLAVWLHLRDASYVDRIFVEDGRPVPANVTDDAEAQLRQQYVDAVAVSLDAEDWAQWELGLLRQDEKLLSALRNDLRRRYGIEFDDLAAVSDLLETRSKKQVPEKIGRAEVFLALAAQIPGQRLDAAVSAMTFRAGSDLFMRPLIPTLEGDFILATWVFCPTPMHFEAWVRPILDDQNTESSGRWAEVRGKHLFENYVEMKIGRVQKATITKRRFSVHVDKYPRITPILRRLKGRTQGFEVDFVIRAESLGFLVSCKGGEKEVPSSLSAKAWAIFPHAEIRKKVVSNLEAMEEIAVEAECVAASEELVQDLGLKGCKRFVPVVVYSVLQPLSLPGFRDRLKSRNILVTTARRLSEILADPREAADNYAIPAGSSCL